jgi:ABC-type sugar transport system permease subunit
MTSERRGGAGANPGSAAPTRKNLSGESGAAVSGNPPGRPDAAPTRRKLRRGSGTDTPSRPSRSSRSSSKNLLRRSNTTAAWVFVTPFLVSFVLFFIVPSVLSITFSLHSYRGYGKMTFVGMGNYEALFASPSFWQAIANTVFYWLVPLPVIMVGAFWLALMLRSKIVRLGRVFKPILFIPQVMAPVAAAMVWKVVLSRNGDLNELFGLDIGWISDPSYGKWSVSLLIVWRAMGWYFVVFLAGLTGISPDILEAAELDGAGAFQRTFRVIVPLMKPIILFAVVIDTIGAIQLFAEPNLLLGGSSVTGAPLSAAPLMNQVVGNISNGQYGLASAVGWVMFIGISVLSVIQFRLLSEKR